MNLMRTIVIFSAILQSIVLTSCLLLQSKTSVPYEYILNVNVIMFKIY